MKKLLLVALAALTAVSLIPVAGAATSAGKQKVSGIVLIPVPFPNTAELHLNSCYSGVHRRAAVASQENNDGLTGWTINVDKKTWGGKFVLKVTDSVGDADLDITFYPEFGTLEQATDHTYAPPTISYEKRKVGGEAGIVPKGMKKAIVCAWAGEKHQGGAAQFKYTASPPRRR